MGGMRPSSTPLENRFVPVVRAAVNVGFGAEPVEIPIAGGSLPDAVWTIDLGRPSFLVPYANRDEANHSPNENLLLENFYAGIRTSAVLLAKLATSTE
jgi:acetylornithine deacetylase/succinyl-diaminopimelate desuccinylase-like protein